MTYLASSRDAEGLSNITPTTALYYSFHTASTTPFFLTSSLEPAVVLGPTEALSELLERGCTLATKPWVDNHWCLILWKLAGMVSLDPGQESDLTQKRWCWSEVMHQLFYRCVASVLRSTRDNQSFIDMSESYRVVSAPHSV